MFAFEYVNDPDFVFNAAACFFEKSRRHLSAHGSQSLESLRSVSLGCLPMTAQKQCVMVGSELHMYLQGNSREVYQYVFGFGGAFGRLWRQRWRDGDGDGGADDERRRRRR